MAKRILSIFGTRPEAIKMAPVIKELEKHQDNIRSLVCVTAQHRQMLDQVLMERSLILTDPRTIQEKELPWLDLT